MSPISKVITKILTKKNNVCCLCFCSVCKDAKMQIHDEVILNYNGTQNTEELITILSYILHDQVLDIDMLDTVCTVCARTAINSYKFIKMCKENSEQLSNALVTLSDCFDTKDDISTFKTLIVTVDVNDLTSKQYYDQKIVQTPKVALLRIKSMSKQRKKREIKDKKKRAHNFSEEITDICDVIKEKNCPTKFKCKGCSNTFIKLFNFKKHYFSQHSPKVLKCSECPRSYGSEALLKQHKYDCHSSLICSECGKTYKNRYSLLYHMRRHTGEQPYECKFCGQKFQWSSRRAEHVRRFHMEPGVECDICHIKFRALGSLYDHRKRHFNPNSRLHIIQTVEEEV